MGHLWCHRVAQGTNQIAPIRHPIRGYRRRWTNHWAYYWLGSRAGLWNQSSSPPCQDHWGHSKTQTGLRNINTCYKFSGSYWTATSAAVVVKGSRWSCFRVDGYKLSLSKTLGKIRSLPHCRGQLQVSNLSFPAKMISSQPSFLIRSDPHKHSKSNKESNLKRSDLLRPESLNPNPSSLWDWDLNNQWHLLKHHV